MSLGIIEKTARSLSCLVIPRKPFCATRLLSTSRSLFGFEEFFDVPQNFGAKEVKVGRAWRIDELRLRSNVDLHKLWYVLLKEKNMLMTMEHALKEEAQDFPNPERIDKVEESMENLEKVVQERNKAYHKLEVGTSGEQEGEQIMNELGVEDFHKYTEHAVPRELNPSFRQPGPYPEDKDAILRFRRLLMEKRRKEANRELSEEYRKVRRILQYYPDTDPRAIAKEYPRVDLTRVYRNRKLDVVRISN